jgi:cation transporter-like permease
VNTVARGWCDNCQYDNQTGALYCAQCGEELQNGQLPRLLIEAVAFGILLAWLIFASAWQLHHASGFGTLQNVGVFFLSFGIMLLLEAAVWKWWVK